VARCPPGRGAEIDRLARGFSDEELAAGGDGDLVAALDDPELVVRRYAIRNLRDCAPDDERGAAEYRPDRRQATPRAGVAWWRARLKDGLIRRGADADAAP